VTAEEPTLQEEPNKSKGISQHISAVVANILEGSVQQFHEEQVRTNEYIRQQTEVMMKIKEEIHHPPCTDMVTLRTEVELKLQDVERRMSEHRKEHAKATEKAEAEKAELEKEKKELEKANRAFVRNIVAGVIVAAIIGLCSYAIIGAVSKNTPTTSAAAK